MKKFGVLSTSVLVTAGLIIYLDTLPININIFTKHKAIQEEKIAEFWQKAKNKFMTNRGLVN